MMDGESCGTYEGDACMRNKSRGIVGVEQVGKGAEKENGLCGGRRRRGKSGTSVARTWAKRKGRKGRKVLQVSIQSPGAVLGARWG